MSTKEERELISKGTPRVYRTFFDKVRITKTYDGCGLSIFVNRINPLTYAYLLFIVALSPIVCLLTTATLMDYITMLYYALFKGRAV